MSTVLLFVRMLVALSLVLGLVALSSRLLRRVHAGASVTQRRPARPLRSRRPAARRAGARGGLFAGLGLRGSGELELELEVLSRRGLNRTASLLVVRAGGRLLLVGATAQSVQLVADLGASGLDGRLAGMGHGALGLELDAAIGDDLGLSGTVLGQLDDDGLTEKTVARQLAAGQFDCTPRTALQDAPGSTTAWDAFLAQLRERTVRR